MIRPKGINRWGGLPYTMSSETTHIEVTFEDIRLIGHPQMRDRNGNVTILSESTTANMDEILLRTLLGIRNYSYSRADANMMVEFTTNVPWNEYLGVSIEGEVPWIPQEVGGMTIQEHQPNGWLEE